MEQPILTDEQKEAFTWVQRKLESVEKLENEMVTLKVIIKNLVQITDNVTVLAPYRKTEAYGRIKEELKKLI